MRESYADLKARVSLQMLLEHYGVDIGGQAGEGQIRMHCPLCGYKKRQSLSINLEKNLFRCFHDGCTQGNVLDFVAAMEDCDLPDAGRRLAKMFPVGEKRVKKRTKNKPLTFELGNIDHDHEEVKTLGIRNPAYYGVGFYTGRGMLAGQIVCPLRDPLEQILGYATFTKGGDTIAVSYPAPEHFCIDADLYVPGIRESCNDKLHVVRDPLRAITLHERGSDVCAYMSCELGDAQKKQIEIYRRSYQIVELQ